MDTLLIDGWLAGLDTLPILDDASTAVARELTRDAGARAGLPSALAEGLVIAASELAGNQLRHARRGRFAVRVVARGGVAGVEIVAADQGNGIPDPRVALAGPGPSQRSLGAGLAAVRRMVHELDVDVRWGQGTCVRARVFAVDLPRAREVGVVGRALPGEQVSGDHAVFLREDERLTCAVIDGIGHGPAAWEASARAAAVTTDHGDASAADILRACDAALGGTRGVVMSAARIDEGKGTLDHAGAGNVTVRVEGAARTRMLVSASSTLGRRGARAHLQTEVGPFARSDVLVMYTDGLATRTTLADAVHAIGDHPVVLAQSLLERFARGTDDALALVAR